MGFLGGWDGGVALLCLFPIKNPNFSLMSEYFLHPWCQFFKLITDRLHCNIFWCRDRTILILVSWNSVEIFTFMQKIPSEYHLNLYINDAYIQTCSCGHLYWKVTFSCPVIENFMWIEPRRVPLVEQDCPPFRSTWVRSRVSVGFVLLDR